MNSRKTRIAVHGAAGRMGRRLVALGLQDPQLELVAALEDRGHPLQGQDAGRVAGAGEAHVPLTCDLAGPVDVVVDFSQPAAAEAITRTCAEQSIPLVMATTGLSADQGQVLREASGVIPIVWAPSMSLAVNLAMKLTEIAAGTLQEAGADADVEIIERHHRFKEDAPSGTALRFGEIIAAAMGQTDHVHGRQGRPGPRPRQQIGYHALRVGDNPGEHTIVFGMPGETLELTVRASSRDCYAQGALAAARFVVDRPPGIYSMFHVLGLD
jgi:4-hydroxy-tetrahydrodipicolinate reductase